MCCEAMFPSDIDIQCVCARADSGATFEFVILNYSFKFNGLLKFINLWD